MAQPPLFLNDLSYPFEFSDDDKIDRCVRQWMSVIYKAKSVADIVLVSSISTVNLRVTENHLMLPSVVARISRDWWTFLRRVEQRSPFSNLEHSAEPNKKRHAVSSENEADAFRWCEANNGFLVSFESTLRWSEPEIELESCECGNGDHKGAKVERLRNISSQNHVDFWGEQLRSYAKSLANSTVVYEGDQYIVRLFYNDHPPAHVHVFANGGYDCIGRVRIDVDPEVMEGSCLRGALRREVLKFIAQYRDQLLAGWLRCREGLVPELVGLTCPH